jgi:alpha-beta hydrolase superfamily lysophospholipase
MSLNNDYYLRVLTDERERDFALLAEHNRQARLAMSGRVSWWRRLLARRGRQDRPDDKTVKIQHPAHRTT